MALWIIFKPLPKHSDFTQKVGVLERILVKELPERNMTYLWIYLRGEPKLYVHPLRGLEGENVPLAIGDTVTVTLTKADLENPKRADAISVRTDQTRIGSLDDHIRRVSESKKYAWLTLLPTVIGLFFLNALREKNVAKAWESERERHLAAPPTKPGGGQL